MTQTTDPDFDLKAETHKLGLEVGNMIYKSAKDYNRDWYYKNVALPALRNYYDAMFDMLKQKHGLPATEWKKS